MPKKIVDFYSLHTYLCNLCCLCLIAVATTKSCCKLLQFNFFPNFIHLEMYYLCKQNKLGKPTGTPQYLFQTSFWSMLYRHKWNPSQTNKTKWKVGFDKARHLYAEAKFFLRLKARPLNPSQIWKSCCIDFSILLLRKTGVWEGRAIVCLPIVRFYLSLCCL